MTDAKRELPRAGEFYSIDGTHIQSEKAWNEIANAVFGLRATFKKHGFKPPVALELASHEDGYRMRHILPNEMIVAYQAESRDEQADDIVFNVLGTEFRYPAHYRKNRKGFEPI